MKQLSKKELETELEKLLTDLMAEKERMIVELQDALKKITILKGYLPICSHCKKIRDDEGYWQSVENYLLDHADVEFSHGICPECAKQHFGVDCDDD